MSVVESYVNKPPDEVFKTLSDMASHKTMFRVVQNSPGRVLFLSGPHDIPPAILPVMIFFGLVILFYSVLFAILVAFATILAFFAYPENTIFFDIQPQLDGRTRLTVTGNGKFSVKVVKEFLSKLENSANISKIAGIEDSMD